MKQTGEYILINVELPDGNRSQRRGVYEGWAVRQGILYLVLRNDRGNKVKYIPRSFLSEITVQNLGGVPESALEELKMEREK